MTTTLEETNVIEKLTKELKEGSKTLGKQEARFLVDTYYKVQRLRINADNQIRAIGQDVDAGPHATLLYFSNQYTLLEKAVKNALDKYSLASSVGQWLRSQSGIGPVLAAGLLAHIDIEKAPTAGHIWSYAGLVPGVEWKSGEKRPWNATLKTLLWKVGENFVKVSNKEDGYYGRIYKERKELEHKKNLTLEYKDQAAAILAKVPKHAQKETYAQGLLPDGHIHSRAKRYAVKLFISHLQHVWYKEHYGVEPPKPYPIVHLGHAHYIPPNNYDNEDYD